MLNKIYSCIPVLDDHFTVNIMHIIFVILRYYEADTQRNNALWSKQYRAFESELKTITKYIYIYIYINMHNDLMQSYLCYIWTIQVSGASV